MISEKKLGCVTYFQPVMPPYPVNLSSEIIEDNGIDTELSDQALQHWKEENLEGRELWKLK